MKRQWILIICSAAIFFFSGFQKASAQIKETIVYDILPIGYCEYQDLGTVELFGKKVSFVVFKTKVVGFDDTEKIYGDQQTGFPLRVERDISMWLHDEDITEEYFPDLRKVLITKYLGGKKAEELTFNAKGGPIQNAIMVPFSLRRVKKLDIGWSTQIRLPEEFKVELDKIEDVTVPAGTFKAYHFISSPKKFEIWISCDELRVPVKITGFGAFSYTMAMKKHTLGEKGQ
ncbi:MAG: hypothetical protein NTY47_02805 [Candidatus Omnitrophica bacterium]|nr:hypothetical protein [Candidatus Omnitrophota bacterium]